MVKKIISVKIIIIIISIIIMCYTVKTPNTDPLSALIPCWKNQPTAEKKNIKKKVIPQCCPHANTN